jgi:malate dehydrogenase (oxaloacetate-decarboxylating)(NADP+)
VVAKAYGGEAGRFGPEYLIPRPFDPRLILEIAPAVAKAAMDSGVATRPIADFEAYRQGLTQFVFRSGLIMKPIFDRAAREPKRVIYAEGEDERVLRAVQVLVDDGLAKPILVGRPEVIATRIDRLGLRIEASRDFEIVNPESDPRYNTYWQTYHRLMERAGMSPDRARTVVRTNNTVIAALAVHLGDADAMLCGVEGRYIQHLDYLSRIIGLSEEAHDFSALSVLILPSGTFFLADTYVTPDPSAQEIVQMTVLAAAHLRRIGMEPKIALLSHSNFGSRDTASAAKMRAAMETLHAQYPELDVEGEMHADAALDEAVRERVFPNSRLSGQANLLIMPNLDAAHIAFSLVKSVGEGLPVGPILIGARAPAHILTSTVTARGVINMSAIAVVDAQDRGQG